MQTADDPLVGAAIQRVLANESVTNLTIFSRETNASPLTLDDSRRIFRCLRETPRINCLSLWNINLRDVLRVFRRGLLDTCPFREYAVGQ
jgi:hypothetical protein